MPISYVVLPSARIVRVRGTDPIDRAAFEDYFTRSRADPQVAPAMPRLVDVRGVTAVAPSGEIREVSRALVAASGLPTGRIAVLVDNDLMTGIARMFGAYSGLGEQMAVFRCEKEAMAWIAE